ncbi:hypothetical protein T3A99_20585 [Pseudomonas sp. N-137]|uniref:hypothetical protein n=1 Tax=Pseudomonas sp. N-137 TaxID=3108452 RepID=UPI002ADEEF64|nr:hypothetical protein [Pseudomonas sp. N-137]MEA1030967.1 hypothetical protein [Pseudomonas sp. N-137]
MALEAATWANVIAGLALFVSVAAAVFSWRSVSQAKRANSIAIHQYQKELHRAFFEVRRLLSGRGLFLKQQELAPYGMILRSSSLYVSEALSAKLLEFYDSCFQVENLHTCLEMNRDYARLIANEETGLAGADFEAHRASADDQVVKARKDLMDCLTLTTVLGTVIESKFVKEIKLS